MENRKTKSTKSNNPIRKCPIIWEEHCKWSGRSDRLRHHLLEDHSSVNMRVFIKESNNKFMLYPNCEASKTFCSKNHLSSIDIFDPFEVNVNDASKNDDSAEIERLRADNLALKEENDKLNRAKSLAISVLEGVETAATLAVKKIPVVDLTTLEKKPNSTKKTAAARKLEMLKPIEAAEPIRPDSGEQEEKSDQTESALGVGERNITVVGAGIQDTVVFERDTAEFEIEISHADIPATWILKKGDEEEELVASKSVEDFDKDVEVEAGDKYQIEVSNRRRTLIVTNCSSADEGDVKCVSEDDETISQLQIEGRDIKILKKLSDMEVTEGEPASFELDVNNENVSGSWEVNGIAVENGDAFETSVRGKKHILKVKFAATEHTGVSFNDTFSLQ